MPAVKTSTHKPKKVRIKGKAKGKGRTIPPLPKKPKPSQTSLISNPITYFITQAGLTNDDVLMYLDLYISESPDPLNKEHVKIKRCINHYTLTRKTPDNPTPAEPFISWDFIASRFHIKPHHFYGYLISGLSLTNINLAKTISIIKSPDVVNKVVERATGDGKSAHSDSRLALELAGLTNQEGNNVIINNNNTVKQENTTINLPPPPTKFTIDLFSQEDTLRDSHKQALKLVREKGRLENGQVESDTRSIIEGNVIEGEVISTLDKLNTLDESDKVLIPV